MRVVGVRQCNCLVYVDKKRQCIMARYSLQCAGLLNAWKKAEVHHLEGLHV